MKSKNKSSIITRDRLLEGACEVFAKKNYRDATIADICKRAGANIAAVNYYFGDKETLYTEAWRMAFHRSLATYPPDGGVPSSAPAEERLHGRILAALRRFADPESHEFEIINRERINPTGLLSEVMRKTIEPLRREFASIIRELMGNRAPEQRILLCQMSIMAQCLDFMVRMRHSELFANIEAKAGISPGKFQVEEMAEHITRFSLAGIREIRRQIENGELAKHANTPIVEIVRNSSQNQHNKVRY